MEMKNKDNYKDLFGISPDKKVTCTKPDHCSYIIPIQSSTFPMFCHIYKRRLYLSESSPIFKCLDSLDLKDVEIIKQESK
jgi:hypothetical protein